MSRLKVFAIAGLAVIAPLGAARAADVPMSLPPLVQKAPVFVEEYQSGWYLRGDLGYRMNDLDGIDAVIGHRVRHDRSMTVSPIGGGGGYKSGWFRADVTIDYAPRASYHRDHARLPPEGRDADDCLQISISISAPGTASRLMSAPAPAYRGIAHRIISATHCCCPIAADKKNRWEFAWAAMGGLTFNLSPNLADGCVVSLSQYGRCHHAASPPTTISSRSRI